MFAELHAGHRAARLGPWRRIQARRRGMRAAAGIAAALAGEVHPGSPRVGLLGKPVPRYPGARDRRDQQLRVGMLRGRDHALGGACLGEVRAVEHEDRIADRHRARMRAAGEDMIRRRKALAEHPVGTLKCRAGYRHFLVRALAKVCGEWSPMALCYNFSRALSILGLERWLAILGALLLLVREFISSLNRLSVALEQGSHRLLRPPPLSFASPD